MSMTHSLQNDKESTITMDDGSTKVVVFTCNWNGLSGLETAGKEHQPYSSNINPIKVKCIGQLSSGVILKTLEHGADGILIIGCSPGECHFRFGNKQAETIFSEAKSLALLLGYQDFQLRLSWISKGDGLAFVEEVQAFIADINRYKIDNG